MWEAMNEQETLAALVSIEKQLTRLSIALYVLARLQLDRARREGLTGVGILEEVLEDGCWPRESEPPEGPS